MARKNGDPIVLEITNHDLDSRAKNWDSFWDLGSPSEVATALSNFYGPGAVKAATCCAVAAQADGRDEDYRFWCAVYGRLTAANEQTSCAS